MEYVLQLQKGDAPARHTTTLHVMLAFVLFGISIFCAALYWFTSVSPNFKGIAYTPFLIFGIISSSGSVTILWLTIRTKTWLQQRRNNLTIRIAELALMVLAAILFIGAGWRMPAMLFAAMAAVLVFALINENRSTPSPKVFLRENEIVIDDVRRKSLAWSGIAQVLLRHGILTISLRDNTFIQRDVVLDTSFAASELEHWSAARIAANADRKPVESW